MKAPAIIIVLAALALCTAQAQVPSILNYQGRVTVAGTNLTTNAAQFKFALVNSNGTTAYWKNDGTTTTGEPSSAVTVAVTQGLYSTLLGDISLANMAALPATVFTNPNVNLRVWFSAGGTNPFIKLSPDQRLGSSGYALRAASADNVSNVTGDLTVAGTLKASKIAAGADADASGANSTVGGGSNNAAIGNLSTVAGGGPNSATGDGSTVSGGQVNGADGQNSVVGGGSYNSAAGYSAVIGGGEGNKGYSEYATIAGGGNNTATNGSGAVVSGGNWNFASGQNSAIGGGISNSARANYATVAGGWSNSASVQSATVAGGEKNTAAGLYAAVGGGLFNNASTNYATIAGGDSSAAGGDWATVGGGRYNTANGLYATVPGGYGGKATNVGSFVWSGDVGEDTGSFGDNTFTVRCEGGARFYTADGTGTGVSLAAGSGAWNNLSDRDAKANFQKVSATDVLAKVAAMPVMTWNYKTQDKSIRHIGPTAQDFRSAFGLGENDKTISTIDPSGVALAAIQGLVEELKERDKAIKELKAKLQAVEQRLNMLPPAP
jgi:hypothetical protein